MIQGKLALKVWLAVATLVVASLLVVGVALDRLITDFYFEQRAGELVSWGENLTRMIDKGGSGVLSQLDNLSSFSGASVMVVDSSGLLQACGNMGMHPGGQMHAGMMLNTWEVEQVLRGSTVVSRGAHPYFSEEVLTVAVPLGAGEGKVGGAVLLYAPLAPINEAIVATRKLILEVAVAAVAVATIMAYFLSLRVARPLVEIQKVAGRMAAGDFTGRVKVSSRDEVGELALAVNSMAEQLKNSIENLAQERDRLNSVVRGMSDGVVSLDQLFNVSLANRAAETLLNSSLKVGEIFPIKEGLSDLARALKQNSMAEAEWQVGGRSLAVRLTPLKGSGAWASGVVCLIQDITFKKQRERVRQEFVAAVSHELRTPLTLIQGYAEAIRDGVGETQEDGREYLEIILEEVARLRRLVDDLLDLNLVEIGRQQVLSEEVLLNSLVQRVVDKYKPVAGNRGVDTLVELEPVTVSGDHDRLQQVIINLLENAFHHTPRGGEVAIRLKAVGDEAMLQISDNGEGIPIGDLPFVFDRFFKVDRSRSRGGQGTGLGLALVKGLVEAHSGRVEVASIWGKGSTFRVFLPLAKP